MRGAVDVAVDVELHDDGRGADGACGRYFRDAGDFAEPALQGRGDGIRHGFRIGAGTGGEDDDRGDVDAGQRGDGEEAIGDDAGKQQSDRQQHGGDGSGNEGSGDVHGLQSGQPLRQAVAHPGLHGVRQFVSPGEPARRVEHRV